MFKKRDGSVTKPEGLSEKIKKNNLKISCLAWEHVNAVLIRLKKMESRKKLNK